ncbi:MAG: six-cysteine ranthipeptide SCIFF [Clostridia bacterium]
MKKEHIITIAAPALQQSKKTGACGNCQASCQSACKTSCTVGNQACESKK